MTPENSTSYSARSRAKSGSMRTVSTNWWPSSSGILSVPLILVAEMRIDCSFFSSSSDWNSL
jgi:hypothetical protein